MSVLEIWLNPESTNPKFIIQKCVLLNGKRLSVELFVTIDQWWRSIFWMQYCCSISAVKIMIFSVENLSKLGSHGHKKKLLSYLPLLNFSFWCLDNPVIRRQIMTLMSWFAIFGRFWPKIGLFYRFLVYYSKLAVFSTDFRNLQYFCSK